MASTQTDRIAVAVPVRVFSTPSTTCQLTTADAWGFVEVNVPTQVVTCVLPLNSGPYTIFDGTGDAATYPITIENAANATVGTINANGGSLSFAWDGTAMRVLGVIAVEGPGASTVGHVALWNNTAGTALKDSANLDGIILGATTPAAGTFTTLAATGATALAALAASGEITATGAGTGLAVTNNATVGGTMAVTGVATVGAASAGAQAVQYEQVVNTPPLGAGASATATTATATTGTFTAPSTGVLIADAWGICTGGVVSLTTTASLGAMTGAGAMTVGDFTKRRDYINMTAGQTTTVSSVLDNGSNSTLGVLVTLTFLPLG